MAVSTTASTETKQVFGYSELFSAGGSDSSLEELITMLDGIDDPFVQTVFILHILMPAMVKVKEDNLDELATSLETMAKYTNDLSAIQEDFNALQDAEESEFEGLAESILSGIDTLLSDIGEVESPLDDTLETQIVNALTGMKDLVLAGGDNNKIRGQEIHYLWNAQTEWGEGGSELPPNPYDPYDSYWWNELPKEMMDDDLNPYFADMMYDPDGKYTFGWHVHDHVWEWYTMFEGSHMNELLDDDKKMKEYLDDFNITGTSMKSQSALTQALVEHDGSEYNAFIALNKDMFKEFHNQVQAHQKGLKNL